MSVTDNHARIRTADTSRAEHRQELAALLELDPSALTDNARLVDDLGLDSLAMMTLNTWLETRGVIIATQRNQPASVGEVLSLLDKASFPGLSIRLTDQAIRSGEPANPFLEPAFGSVDAVSGSLAPVLSSHGIRLNPVEPDDVRFLYALSIHPETCYRWRYRGAPPPIDRFAADLWSQVLVQFVARRNDDNEPVGHLVCYGADMGQRYAYVGAVFRPEYTGSGLAAQVVTMFVRYLFHTFAMRKFYVEIPGFNWPQVRSGEGRLFQVEGIMRNHEHYAGRYWDRYICAIYPEAVTDASE